MRTILLLTLLWGGVYLSTLFAQTASLTSGCAPLTVDFMAPTGPSTFFWDFGNGANSNEENPSTTFTQSGTYTVELQESAGGDLVGSVTITVFEQPTLNIAVDTTRGCIPLDLQFTDLSTVPAGITVTDYSWVFGDGGSSGLAMPNHIYNTPGQYSVSLQLLTDQEGCDVTEIFPDLVTVGGVQGVNFFTIPNPAIVCEPPLTVGFVNGTSPIGLTFDWDFGNGNSFNGVAPPNEVYTEPGVFDVRLTASDSLGCTGERTRTVAILSPISSLAVPDTVCLEEYVYYENFAFADTIEWTWPESSRQGIDELGAAWTIFTEPGFNEVQLRLVNNNPIVCELDTTLMIWVDTVNFNLTGMPSFTCENMLTTDFAATSNTGASFVWTSANGELGFGPAVTFTYEYLDTLEFQENGLTPYLTELIATNPSGCRDTLYHIDTIFTPNALFMPDVVSGCAPLTVQFEDLTNSFSEVLTYEYQYGDGQSAIFTQDTSDHFYTYTEPGEYGVVLTIENANGCIDTSYVRTIEVGAPVDIEFVYDESVVCVDDSIGYTVINPPDNIDWYQFEEPDTLYVFENGCLSQIINTDHIIAGPKVELSYELDCDDPYRVHFTSETYDATSLLWEFGDGTTSMEDNPSHEYSVRGDFWAKVTAFNSGTDCPAYTDSTLICIRDIQAMLDFPDVVCRGDSIDLDASATLGVAGEFCSNGFTWYFERSGRPVQGNDTILRYPFTITGTETVTLVTKDINGCRDTISKNVEIYDVYPDLMVTDDFICLPTEVTFTDLSTADTTLLNWSWDFGDDQTADSPLTATHIYTTVTADTVFATLTVQDVIGCTAMATIPITIYEPVSMIEGMPDLTGCVGDEVSFTATQFTIGGSSLSFGWDVGDGITGTNQSIARTYDQPGTYPVILTYEEIATGCGGMTQEVVSIQSYPTAAFTSSVDEEPVICAPAQIAFTNGSSGEPPLSYRWEFGNGQSSNTPNPVASFDRGTYEVLLTTSTTFGCEDTFSQTYEVVGPQGAFTFGPQAICQGEAVTFELVDTSGVTSFSWDVGDGNVISNENPLTYTYEDVPVLGPRPVTLTLLGENEACELAITETLLIRDVNAAFTVGVDGDSTICVGNYELVNLSTGADNYNWTLADGSTSTEFNPAGVAVPPGTYTISLMVSDNGNNCEDAFSQQVTFVEPPAVEVFADPVCAGDTAELVILNIEPDWIANWSPTTGFISPSNSLNPLVVIAETTSYTVSIIDAEGCSSDGVVELVIPPALPDLMVDATACPEDSIAALIPLLDPTIFQFQWEPQNGSLPAEPPAVIGVEDLDYLLIVNDLAGCDTMSFPFFIQSVSDSILVPEIFSPNDDGLNDIFRLFTEMDLNDPEQVFIESFEVYNRWGKLVYDASGPDARWDGTFNGEAAPADVYLYRIVVDVRKAGRREDFKGAVTLVR